MIPDDYEAIDETIQRLSSLYDFVFTSGGIGPTHDDITYTALARSFDLPMTLDQETCELMTQFSQLKDPQWALTDARKRMATFPDPFEIVLPRHPTLWVPIVIVNGNVYVFPGIPRLFEALLESAKPHFLSRVTQQAYHRVQIATKSPEGVIAPFLAQVQEDCSSKQIKIGSYPYWKVGKDGARVVVSVVGKNEQDVQEISDVIVKGVDGWITKGKESTSK